MSSRELVVLGSERCGWTKRQTEELDKAGVQYKRVECPQGELCKDSRVQGYPALVVQSCEGPRCDVEKLSVGFQTVDSLRAQGFL
jgi:hypothetical protein